ncbi:MAG: hypothetical protein C5B50_16940 [Verrucomicrobia bacterium]|nr:MAG: hypothetical protein C5B50_16940 [Verrucomicrobiota bacterium]
MALSLSSRFGPRILAAGDGKFTNAEVFVYGRVREGVLLLTAACLLLLAYRIAACWTGRRFQAPARWVLQCWSGFICLNVFAAIAARTVLFWCLLYGGKNQTHNYTQWQIKKGLLPECPAPSQAVLLGASQTRAQIDTKILNERLGSKIWTTELHFPGCTAYDILLCLERLPNVHLDYVITYFSEANFFGDTSDNRLMYFFGLRDLPGYLESGSGKPSFDRYLVCGLFGDVFPLYRVWEPVTTRVQFWGGPNQAQEQYDALLDTDLSKRAQIAARGIKPGPETAFQKRAFVALANACRARNCRLIVCCGQVNPIFHRALDPSLRPDMLAFLREQATKASNIVLLEESQCPAQTEGDYTDLTHVTETARGRFSRYVAEVMERLHGGK